jgi:hypothetical protein
VTVKLAQGDLPGGDEAVEQQERGTFAGQQALRLDAPAKLLVQPFNDVRGAQRLPLLARKVEDGQQLVVPLLQAA